MIDPRKHFDALNRAQMRYVALLTVMDAAVLERELVEYVAATPPPAGYHALLRARQADVQAEIAEWANAQDRPMDALRTLIEVEEDLLCLSEHDTYWESDATGNVTLSLQSDRTCGPPRHVRRRRNWIGYVAASVAALGLYFGLRGEA